MLHVAREGAGPPVALVHGFTQTVHSWRPVARHLTDGYEVVAVDLPGHGGSGGVVADLPGTADLVGAAVGRAAYVGYSLGGRVLLHLALARPDLVRALVVLGATGGIDDPGERADRRRADEALAASVTTGGVDAFLDRWLAQPLFASLPADATDRADRGRNTAAGLAASLRAAGTGTQEPLWDRLGAVTVPVLVLAGERDEKFGAAGRRLAAAIGPSARFEVVPGAGHAAHLEQPAAFVALLQPFLDEWVTAEA